MLSGIWDFKFKWVKNSSQHPGLLFTNAQKSVILAFKLYKNGVEKDPTPFMKVVE
jgi:hypothetical protein